MNKVLSEHAAKPYFEFSRAITRYYAKSFYFSAQFLPRDVRWATYAVYGFCRHADNIVDNPRLRTQSQIIAELDSLCDELRIAWQTGESENPALFSFVRVGRSVDMPIEYPLDLIEGVRMDLTKSRYNNFDELYIFCYRVASVVGLMMTYVLGFRDERALEYAEKMGIAMQLTNILRDIEEDMQMGRIYIPINELQQFGISPEDIINKNFSDNFKELMQFQIRRARDYYQKARPGVRMLDRSSRFAIYAASSIYGKILDKIEENGCNPFLGRAFVPKSEKISILFRELIKSKLNLNI
ncbi:MAG: phytoene/squalene synthase family protein [Candidatus Kapaibacterium sp.]